MDDYKYLRKIEAISPDNEFIRYIINRVTSDRYRGGQCSQHNRLTFEYFSKVIDAIYSTAQGNVFEIHVGDDNGEKQAQANTYYKIVDKINSSIGRGTINSVKKNTFPDMARMGFIDRYDRRGIKITEGTGRKTVYRVGLSELGIKFAEAAPFGKIKFFTDGVDVLTKNTASELVELLYLNDYGIDSINILEYMYVFSDMREEITLNDKLFLLLEYRRLSNANKEVLDILLKQFCNPENRRGHGDKTILRDYSNWKNESQQIFGLFANSTYFKVEGRNLLLNTGTTGLFDTKTNRGEKAKADYFKNHKIEKANGYDLHHIVPFSRAENKRDTIFIDDYKNLIYLKAQKHTEFTISGSKNVIMEYTKENPCLLFVDLEKSYIIVDITKDALFNKSLLPLIKNYNEILLKKFYYV